MRKANISDYVHLTVVCFRLAWELFPIYILANGGAPDISPFCNLKNWEIPFYKIAPIMNHNSVS